MKKKYNHKVIRDSVSRIRSNREFLERCSVYQVYKDFSDALTSIESIMDDGEDDADIIDAAMMLKDYFNRIIEIIMKKHKRSITELFISIAKSFNELSLHSPETMDEDKGDLVDHYISEISKSFFKVDI